MTLDGPGKVAGYCCATPTAAVVPYTGGHTAVIAAACAVIKRKNKVSIHLIHDTFGGMCAYDIVCQLMDCSRAANKPKYVVHFWKKISQKWI